MLNNAYPVCAAAALYKPFSGTLPQVRAYSKEEYIKSGFQLSSMISSA